MKKTVIISCCVAAALAGGVLTGCDTAEKEITSTAPEVEALITAAQATGWANVKDSFAALDAQADEQAAAITKDNAKETLLGYIEQVRNTDLDILVAAAQADEIDAEAEAAAQDAYVIAKTMLHFGSPDTIDTDLAYAQDVSLYLGDFATDTLYLIENLYDGQVANVDARSSEVQNNYDRIVAFSGDKDASLHEAEKDSNPSGASNPGWVDDQGFGDAGWESFLETL